MAAVWLHDGSVEGTGMMKNRTYFFFIIFLIGIHTLTILTIIIYNTNVTGYTNITYNSTATSLPKPYHYLRYLLYLQY